MTNEQRQASLEKKNGMNGMQEYCDHCNCKLLFACYPNGYCSVKSAHTNTYHGTPCATAFNRMIRENAKK